MGNLFNFDPVSMDSITSFANGKFAEGFEEALKRINDNFTRINGITPGKGDRGDSVVYVPVNFNFVWVATLCTNSNGNVALSNGKINMSTFNNWLSSIEISLSSEHIKILEDAWSDFEIFCSNANLAITDNTIKSYGSLCYAIYNEMVRVLLEWSGRDKLKPMYISDETLDETSWILYDALWFCNDWKTEDYSAHAAPGVNLRTVLPYKKPGEVLPELKSLVSKIGRAHV